MYIAYILAYSTTVRTAVYLRRKPMKKKSRGGVMSYYDFMAKPHL